MVKHYKWQTAEASGRIAVRLDSSELIISQLAGNAPPFEIMNVLYPHLIDMGLKEISEKNTEFLKNRIAVQSWSGISGCETWIVREERNPRLEDYPIIGGLYSSMYQKLNRGVRIRPEIFWILYGRLEFSAVEVEKITLREVPAYRGENWERIEGA